MDLRECSYDETPTPIEPLTPIQSSGTYRLYSVAAQEFKFKLKPYTDPEVFMMTEGLEHYVEIINSWSPTNRPDDATRKRLIEEFLDLCSQINNYLDIKRKKKNFCKLA